MWRMLVACWILKATNTQLEYVILIAFHCKNGCTNAPRLCCILSLPVLVIFALVFTFLTRLCFSNNLLPSGFRRNSECALPVSNSCCMFRPSYPWFDYSHNYNSWKWTTIHIHIIEIARTYFAPSPMNHEDGKTTPNPRSCFFICLYSR